MPPRSCSWLNTHGFDLSEPTKAARMHTSHHPPIALTRPLSPCAGGESLVPAPGPSTEALLSVCICAYVSMYNSTQSLPPPLRGLMEKDAHCPLSSGAGCHCLPIRGILHKRGEIIASLGSSCPPRSAFRNLDRSKQMALGSAAV